MKQLAPEYTREGLVSHLRELADRIEKGDGFVIEVSHDVQCVAPRTYVSKGVITKFLIDRTMIKIDL